MPPDDSQPVRAFVLCVGDELLSGITQDINTPHICSALARVGVQVIGQATTGDDLNDLERALRQAAGEADVVIAAGGLGPTPDDLTRQALANVVGAPLVRDEAWVAHMIELFRHRGRPMHEGNRQQADVPRGARLLWNPTGTAAGIECRMNNATLYALPGVPEEMRRMLQEHCLPALQARAGRCMLLTRSLHTVGLGESDVAGRLGPILKRRPHDEGLQVGTTASRGVVSIRIYAAGADEATAVARLDEVDARIRLILGELVFGRDDQTLPQVVGELLRAHPRRPMLSLAESCTGGLIATMITDVPGSSEFFARGLVTYANEAKMRLLGVPPPLLTEHGAVSEPVAEAMARGALAGEAGLALAITGIAGPGGGSETKPVGTVCIALVDSTGLRSAEESTDHAWVRTFRFVGDRQGIRNRGALVALALLRHHLLGHDLTRLPY